MNIRIILLIIGASVLVWGCDEQFFDDHNPPRLGDDESGIVVAPAYSGGYFVAGLKYYAGQQNDLPDLYFAAFDEGGGLRWTTAYATDSHNRPLAAQESGDRGFLVLGERLTSNGSPIYYVLKVTEDGHVDWQQNIFGTNLTRVIDADGTDDGGFVLLGYSGPDDETTVAKIDAGGGVDFVSAYGNSHVPVDVQEVSGGYVLLSNVDRSDVMSSVSLIRTDNFGNVEWGNLIWSGGWFAAWHVAEANDGGLLIVAESNNGEPDLVPMVIKTDPQGHYLWRSDFGEMTGATINAVISNWNGLMLAGDMGYSGGHDGFAMRANDRGEWLWWRTYGGDRNDDWFNDAIAGNGGGYVLAGTSASFNNRGDTDLYLVKLSSDGSILWESIAGD